MKLFQAAPLLARFGCLGLESAWELESIWNNGADR